MINRRPAALFVLVSALLILLAAGVLRGQSAQDESPALTGPLVAAGAAARDHILLYDLGSGARRRLSFGEGWQYVWGFSPDGCRLLLTISDGLEPAQLYTARLDGNDLRPLVQYDAPAGTWGVWAPRWQPGGQRIAFVLIQGPPDAAGVRDHRIAWVDAAGGAPGFYSASGDEHEPEWSPDGRWLAYITFSERVPGADIYSTAAPTPPGQVTPLLREADVWVVSADGATKYALTRFDTGSVRAPRWSPDSELLGFVYSPSPGNDQLYMIANQPGAIPTQLTAKWSLALDAIWMPDGTALLAALRSWRDDVRDNRLWTIPLVGGADANAALYPDGRTPNHADYPRFSPDGRWLALRSEYALTLVDLSSGTWSVPDGLPPDNTPPVWSPAGFNGEAACG